MPAANQVVVEISPRQAEVGSESLHLSMYCEECQCPEGEPSQHGQIFMEMRVSPCPEGGGPASVRLHVSLLTYRSGEGDASRSQDMSILLASSGLSPVAEHVSRRLSVCVYLCSSRAEERALLRELLAQLGQWLSVAVEPRSVLRVCGLLRTAISVAAAVSPLMPGGTRS